jgi:hypothetical protein
LNRLAKENIKGEESRGHCEEEKGIERNGKKASRRREQKRIEGEDGWKGEEDEK